MTSSVHGLLASTNKNKENKEKSMHLFLDSHKAYLLYYIFFGILCSHKATPSIVESGREVGAYGPDKAEI